ncbi:MAG: hypothetical protein ACPKPY_13210 [Nitrososphaeraceae archaeon]
MASGKDIIINNKQVPLEQHILNFAYCMEMVYYGELDLQTDCDKWIRDSLNQLKIMEYLIKNISNDRGIHAIDRDGDGNPDLAITIADAYSDINITYTDDLTKATPEYIYYPDGKKIKLDTHLETFFNCEEMKHRGILTSSIDCNHWITINSNILGPYTDFYISKHTGELDTENEKVIPFEALTKN